MSTSATAADSDASDLQKSLLSWYRHSRRNLPWRRTRDPYAIWISEIMLQQTRVAAVLDKYAQFLAQFPNVKALADASLDEVLTVWSGLGYYRRARALHQAAQMVVHHLHGKFPDTAAGWRQLPGIGRYTSAAIASIAFNEPAAVVDGNVERVLERLDGERHEGERLWERAEQLLAKRAPGDWNQAMMELGATICLPQNPQCLVCPVNGPCKTRGPLQSRPQPKRKRAELWYALYARKNSVLLVQRPADHSLMAGMWELPAIRANGVEPLHKLRHSITDTDYAVFVVRGRTAKKHGKWVTHEEAHRMAITGLTRKILRKHFAREA
ncbi:A/G-specific DNA glycosylase [Candidatus Koribacter versatilis Ellin345]|uniref:Adenine DNA glycosylase n=1 Tax=Koribacter versatilis (strain Ellin345) TaxID=204669 RepID=Q1ITJ1_KORVE|nr:A/G-specific adenine glycosylase [Candidatus Koribacter versatilis]ABF39809.1 A/G-specific DNA glycosylase [Candidatus Koribacter versatilis Ellin345]